MNDNDKLRIADAIYKALDPVPDNLIEGFDRVEVTRISGLLTQIKVWPKTEPVGVAPVRSTAPRYFNIKVSEMM